MFKLLLIAAFAAVAMSADLPFEICGGGWPAPVRFAVPECPGTPCGLPVGATITLNIWVEVDRITSQLPVSALVTTPTAQFYWDLPTGDACGGIAGGCPISPGEHLITFPLTIANVTPGETVTTRVEIANEAGGQVACGYLATTFN